MGKSIALEVEISDTIAEIKAKIHDQEKIPPFLQRLVWAGRVLEDDRQLYDYYTPRESSIYLILRLGASQFLAMSRTPRTRRIMKDVNKFRESIQNNYLPVITDLSYEGIFCDYFFHTGNEQHNNNNDEKALFSSSYSMAFTKNPLQEDRQQPNCDYYMTVRLNSNVTGNTCKRNPVNLVVCIDRSEPMGFPFNRDHHSNSEQNATYDSRSKMSITLEVVSKLIDHLKPNDRLSIITFDTSTSIIQPMRILSEINLENLRKEIAKISSGGGTNMSAAIIGCASLFDTTDEEYDNQIVFLTNTQPHRGELGAGHFFFRIRQLTLHRIYMTFVGVGMDLHTEFISLITKYRGAKYFSVHDSKTFLKLFDEDFDLILTRFVFNVRMKLESDLFDIEQVFNSPEWDETRPGELMKTNISFPARTDEHKNTRGEIVLVKLKTKKTIIEKVNTTAYLSVNYEDRLGRTFESKQLISILVNSDIHYGNFAIRKATLLFHYVTLLKKWINDERERMLNRRTTSLNLYETRWENLRKSEQKSAKLIVSKQNRQQFEQFLVYFQSEMTVLQDKDLDQEVKLMKKLIDYEQ